MTPAIEFLKDRNVPFGMKRPLAVVMDSSLMTFEKVAINGGKRGVMLIMRPRDVAWVTHAQVIDL